MEDLRVHSWRSVRPLSVEIWAWQRRPIVSEDHAIWIQHWNKLEHISVSQLLSHFIIWDHKPHHTLNDETWVTLTRMHSSCHNHSLPSSYLLIWGIEVGDDDQIKCVTSQTLTHYCSSANSSCLVCASFKNQRSDVSVGIWEPMCYVHLIIFICTLEVKAQCVPSIRLGSCLIIADVIPSTEPTRACFFTSLCWVKQNPHTMIVHGIRLDKVGDVEPVICVFLCVGEPKIEPLGVSLAVVIRFHSQVILEFTYLSGSF